MGSNTIKDVAKLAGVGVGTVSRVLNNHRHVSVKTREVVLEAIAELQFQPNPTARRLPRRINVMNIGVISQSLINYHAIAERLRGVQLALAEKGNPLEIVLYSASSPDNYRYQLSRIIQQSAVKGLLLIDLNLDDAQRNDLKITRMPFVGLNNFQAQNNWTCIGTNNIDGGYIATKHLIELGHTRIAYVGDLFEDVYMFQTSHERYLGYVKALEEANIPLDPQYVKLGPYGFNNAQHMVKELMESASPTPTAIFAMSDIQALGCQRGLRNMGYSVPDDISIIGYDDLEVSEHAGLTTVNQHLELAGRVGIEHLFGVMQGDQDLPAPNLPNLEVITRYTTRSIHS